MSDTHDSESRTERATPRRLQKAQEEGSIPRAHNVAGAAVLLAGAAMLLFGGARIIQQLEVSLSAGLDLAPEHMRDPSQLAAAAMRVVEPGLAAVAPFLFLMAAVAFIADIAIGGWTLSATPLVPDLSRINPLKGFGRLFSHAALAEIVKALVKFIVVAAIATWLMRSRLAGFLHAAAETWPFAAHHVAGLIVQIFLILAASLAVVSLFEVPYQIWAHRDQLKMSRQDIKDEMRELDGSPQTRRRIRSLRLKMARGRMMSEVPKADVVIVNPEHYAAALSYRDGGMRAPRVVAKGTGRIALRIRDVAGDNSVPVVEAPPLARAIWRAVDLGDEIPAGLYGAVAEMLAYVYRLGMARRAGAPLPTVPQDGRFDPPPDFVR
ncbi:MAG TPA: flagellar biosynthesis protein FlhB [Stellaceae bacterium]|jgi:flagellar biosynthetic protein FlhB|nr:flagellar biosynthesis protein FlhB [Stellaceae bacterium]